MDFQEIYLTNILKLENGSNLIFDLNEFKFHIKILEYKIEPDHNHDEQYWKERLGCY